MLNLALNTLLGRQRLQGAVSSYAGCRDDKASSPTISIGSSHFCWLQFSVRVDSVAVNRIMTLRMRTFLAFLVCCALTGAGIALLEAFPVAAVAQ